MMDFLEFVDEAEINLGSTEQHLATRDDTYFNISSDEESENALSKKRKR